MRHCPSCKVQLEEHYESADHSVGLPEFLLLCCTNCDYYEDISDQLDRRWKCGLCGKGPDNAVTVDVCIDCAA